MTARDCTHPSRTWDGWFESCRKCGACAGDRRGPDGLRYATFDEEES